MTRRHTLKPIVGAPPLPPVPMPPISQVQAQVHVYRPSINGQKCNQTIVSLYLQVAIFLSIAEHICEIVVLDAAYVAGIMRRTLVVQADPILIV